MRRGKRSEEKGKGNLNQRKKRLWDGRHIPFLGEEKLNEGWARKRKFLSGSFILWIGDRRFRGTFLLAKKIHRGGRVERHTRRT